MLTSPAKRERHDEKDSQPWLLPQPSPPTAQASLSSTDVPPSKRHDSPPNPSPYLADVERLAAPDQLSGLVSSTGLHLILYSAPWVTALTRSQLECPTLVGGKVSRRALVDCFDMLEAPDVAQLVTYLPCLQLWRDGFKILEQKWPLGPHPLVHLPFQLPPYGKAHGKPSFVCVLVSASWCKPCQRLGLSYNQLCEEYKDHAVFAKCEYDTNPTFRAQYGVEKIPTIVVLREDESSSSSPRYVDKLQNSDVEKVKFFLDKTMGVFRLVDDF